VKNGKQVLRGVLRIKFGNLNIFIKKNNMVQPKYSPEEALQRVKLMMGYDLKKSLRENIKSTGVILNEQDGSGVGPEEAVNIAYEIYSEMAGDVESEDLNDVIEILKSKVIGKTWDEGGCLLNKVIEYYKTQSGKASWSWGGMTTGNLIKDITDSKEQGEAQFEDVKKRLLGLINTELAGFCKTGAKKDETKKDETKKDEKVKTGGGGGTKQAPKIPAELKDIDGVKKFQDWLDKNKAGWATGFSGGVLNQAGGYGRFGPRTTRAWNSYGQEYLKGGTSKPEEKPEVGGEVQNVNATSTEF
jgi:hypothetical protein